LVILKTYHEKIMKNLVERGNSLQEDQGNGETGLNYFYDYFLVEFERVTSV
jgi:hypothetical protein